MSAHRALAAPGRHGGTLASTASADGPSRPLTSPDLDDMCDGTVHLSVPLVDDVIQVGAHGDLATATIAVSKHIDAVSVWRIDGRLVQAQILHERRGYGGTTVRVDVFPAPVPSLDLVRLGTENGRGLWFAATHPEVERHQHLQQFIVTIATFGLAKQRANAGPPRRSTVGDGAGVAVGGGVFGAQLRRRSANRWAGPTSGMKPATLLAASTPKSHAEDWRSYACTAWSGASRPEAWAFSGNG